MAKSLLIVESPAKAKTIKKYLGKDFEVKASIGHVRDLPKNDLGVDVENGFEPTYVVSSGKEKVIKDLKRAADKAEEIYLATDPDREGEAIAWHIKEALDKKDRVFRRVLFHEITKEAIQKALENPEELNRDRFESQQARRILDRLVGYNISPLLWDKVKRGLSAGRVQSVALRLIVERERAIRAFVPEEYWSLTARLKAADPSAIASPPAFEARLSKIEGKKADIKNEEAVRAVVESLRDQPFSVAKVTKKGVKKRPLPPLVTSTMQMEAFNKLGFPAAKTMSVAQKLYEGVELGDEGAVGLITYMRTDSPRLSPAAQAEAKQFIVDNFGPDYAPARPTVFKSPKRAQEAHEAIRPTSVRRTPEEVKKYLTKDGAKLYELIWRRFVASQMAPAVIDQTGVDITAGECLFRASGSVVRFEGWRKVWPNNDKEGDGLPELTEGQALELIKLDPKQHFTQPPPRFTDASLVKELEERGIGRPSTYASILTTLQDKEYANRVKGRYQPTELGMLVTDLLVESFPRLMDAAFTAQMEGDLDQVEEGKVGWRETLTKFYGPFSEALQRARESMADLKGQGLPTDVKCPNCGKPMHIRLGRAGQFLACTGYPECKTTSDFTRDENGNIVPEASETVEETCPNCGKPMRVKSGRFGRFLACTGYPDCKTTKPLNGEDERPADEPTDEKCDKCGAPMVIKRSRWGSRFMACSAYPKCKNSKPLPIGVACPRPDCGGQLVERSSKRGKVFYGCSNYPDCDYVAWQKPVDKACPECGHPFMLLKKLKAGPTYACPAKGCGHKEPAQD